MLSIISGIVAKNRKSWRVLVRTILTSSTSTSPLHAMHFPAILRSYNGMTAYICRRFIPTTAFVVNILLKENQNCRVIGGLAQLQWYIWPKTDCWLSDSRADFRRGRTSLILPPGAENPSYATVRLSCSIQGTGSRWTVMWIYRSKVILFERTYRSARQTPIIIIIIE